MLPLLRYGIITYVNKGTADCLNVYPRDFVYAYLDYHVDFTRDNVQIPLTGRVCEYQTCQTYDLFTYSMKFAFYLHSGREQNSIDMNLCVLKVFLL